MKRISLATLFIAFALLLVLSTSVVYSYIDDVLKHDLSIFGIFHVDNKPTYLQFVGDVMIARNVEKLSRVYGSDYPYRLLTQKKQSTILVGNFEASVPLVHIPTPSLTFAFSVDPEFLKPLRGYGFDYVSLANNHSYDYGAEGYSNTKAKLTETSIVPFGDQRNQGSSTIGIVSLEGTKVALIGITAVYQRPPQADIETLLIQAQKESDVQIAYVHFGTEYDLIHSNFQQELSYALIDAGADAVIGHHPHVVQDIQLYKGVPIFYSLGNFIFDQYFSTEVQEGLSVVFSQTDSTRRFELNPTTSIGTRSQARMMEEKEKSAFLIDLAKRSDSSLKEMVQKGVIELEK